MLRNLIGFVTILLISGGAVSMPRAHTASLSQQHIVEIQAFSFQPQKISVSPGDTIIWINRDIVPHTVTANGGTWESRKLEEGQSLKVVIENNGAYAYFCKFHPNMTGVLTAQ